MSELQSRLFDAESEVQALVRVIEGLEAHIMDRANNDDPAKPETYLSILRGDFARVKESSAAICAARWNQYREQQARIDHLTAELARKDAALREARSLFLEYAEHHRAQADGLNEIVRYAGDREFRELVDEAAQFISQLTEENSRLRAQLPDEHDADYWLEQAKAALPTPPGSGE